MIARALSRRKRVLYTLLFNDLVGIGVVAWVAVIGGVFLDILVNRGRVTGAAGEGAPRVIGG